MKEYDDLVLIIGVLSEHEYLSEIVDKRKKNSDDSFQVKLISFVIKNSLADKYQAQNFLYGRLKPVAFQQLVHRTKEKLLDTVSSDSLIKKYEYYDNRSRDILLLRKRLIQFDILVLRGLVKLSISLLNKIIQKAKDYEYYLSLIHI